MQQNISNLLDHPLCEEIPVPQPSRYYPCPSGRDHFSCSSWCLETLFGVVFTKFMVYFGEELCCGRFLLRKFKLIFRIFELVSHESKTLSLSD